MIEIEIMNDKYESFFKLNKDNYIYDCQDLKLDKGTYRLDVFETYDNRKLIRIWRIDK